MSFVDRGVRFRNQRPRVGAPYDAGERNERETFQRAVPSGNSESTRECYNLKFPANSPRNRRVPRRQA